MDDRPKISASMMDKQKWLKWNSSAETSKEDMIHFP